MYTKCIVCVFVSTAQRCRSYCSLSLLLSCNLIFKLWIKHPIYSLCFVFALLPFVFIFVSLIVFFSVLFLYFAWWSDHFVSRDVFSPYANAPLRILILVDEGFGLSLRVMAFQRMKTIPKKCSVDEKTLFRGDRQRRSKKKMLRRYMHSTNSKKCQSFFVPSNWFEHLTVPWNFSVWSLGQMYFSKRNDQKQMHVKKGKV